MSMYDSLKNSYLRNKKEIDKLFKNKSTKVILNDDDIKVLKVLIDLVKDKIKNKPDDLRKFKPSIYFSTTIAKDLTGLSTYKQEEE